MEQLVDVFTSGCLVEHEVKTEKTVNELLGELDLDGKVFAVLVDGKKAKMTDSLREGASIVILPMISGGT